MSEPAAVSIVVDTLLYQNISNLALHQTASTACLPQQHFNIVIPQAVGIINHINGTIAVVGGLFIMTCFFFVPILRKHPNSLLFWNSLADVASHLYTLLITYIPQQSELVSRTSCTPNAQCLAGAFFYQFLTMASVTWNVVISTDLFLTIRKPFHAHKSSREVFIITICYHLFAWGTSLISASLILIGYNDIGFVPQYESCWIQNPFSYYRLIMLIPITLYLIFAVFVLLYAVVKLRHGLPQSERNRRSLIIRLLLYTIFFLLFFIGPLIYQYAPLVFRSFLTAKDDNGINMVQSSELLTFLHVFSIIDSVCENGQAIVDVLVFGFHPAIWEVVKRLFFCCSTTFTSKSYASRVEAKVFLEEFGKPVPELDEEMDDETDLETSETIQFQVVQVMNKNELDLSKYEQKQDDNVVHFGVDVTDLLVENYDKFSQQQSVPNADLNESLLSRIKVPRTTRQKERLSSSITNTSNNTMGINIDAIIRRDMIYCIMLAINKTVEMTRNALYQDPEQSKQGFFSRLVNGNKDDPFKTVTKHAILRDEELSVNSETKFLKRVKNALFSSSRTINFVEYAPLIFNSLRPSDFLSSFKTDDVLDSFIKENFSEGKSGSFFCKTADNRYIIKTVTNDELKTMLSILPKFYNHLIRDEKSLLPRFCGLYSITMYQGVSIKLVVMNNVFYEGLNKEPSILHERYDLKGSWVNRRAFKDGHPPSVGALGLDLDMNKPIHIGTDRANNVLAQLKSDAEFLASVGIMDYSLLIGIHHGSKTSEQPQSSEEIKIEIEKQITRQIRAGSLRLNNLPDRTSLNNKKYIMDVKYVPNHDDHLHNAELNLPKDSTHVIYDHESGDIYFIGVIDVLQEYNLSKKAELAWKRFVLRKDGRGISSQHPDYYADRFLQRMSKVIVS